MVAIHRFLLGHKRFCHDARQRRQYARHHHFPVMTGKILRPRHGFHIVVIVFTSLFEIGQVFIRQVRNMLLHILLGQRDKQRTNGVTHAARTAM